MTMLTRAENDLLTHVTGDAPLARLMRRHCWMPFARTDGVTGQPQRVRLLGQDFVAFRGDDGRVGVVDERCPHRGVSLALAHVEGCTLRCIYHGWRINASGAVVEVPSAGAHAADAGAQIKYNHYPVREAGGLVWVYLGKQTPPPLPRLPFIAAAPEMRFIARTIVPCNWLQALEGGLDSAHVGWLHRSWFPAGGEVDPAKIAASPAFKTKETPYGLRAAAIRTMPDHSYYVRIAEFLMPFTILLRTDRPTSVGAEYSSFMMTPIDNESHLLFWYIWNPAGPLDDVIPASHGANLDNFATLDGGRETNWGQDRAAMANGHFSGFTRMLIQEDVAAQVSMGRVADRTLENLCSTDAAIAQTRRQLLRLIKQFENGEPLDDVFQSYSAKGKLPYAGMIRGGFRWEDDALEPAPN